MKEKRETPTQVAQLIRNAIFPPRWGLSLFFWWLLCWLCEHNGIIVLPPQMIHAVIRDHQQENSKRKLLEVEPVACTGFPFCQSDANWTTANFAFNANDIMVPIWPPQKLHTNQQPRIPKMYWLNSFCVLLGPAPNSIKKSSQRREVNKITYDGC